MYKAFEKWLNDILEENMQALQMEIWKCYIKGK